jgi:hypothetical protein
MPLADEAEKQPYDNLNKAWAFLSTNAANVELDKLIAPSVIV